LLGDRDYTLRSQPKTKPEKQATIPHLHSLEKQLTDIKHNIPRKLQEPVKNRQQNKTLKHRRQQPQSNKLNESETINLAYKLKDPTSIYSANMDS
jgi:regulator of replication initiation timing